MIENFKISYSTYNVRSIVTNSKYRFHVLEILLTYLKTMI